MTAEEEEKAEEVEAAEPAAEQSEEPAAAPEEAQGEAEGGAPAGEQEEAEVEAGSDEVDESPDEAGSGAPEAESPEPEAKPDKPAGEGVKEAKAKDLPPGADLEPISLEPEVELDAEEQAAREAEAEERAAREAELTSDEAHDEAPIAAAGSIDLPKDSRIQATGKRKRSVARVVILPGDGKITVNGREFEEYFPRARHRTVVSSPLVATGFDGKVEVRVLVHGGGVSGQAGAARHGIARGLTEALPELRSELKRRGFLTRDSRAKERRKAGLKKARKRPQFSKR